ncbi:MAG: phosphoglucosamine mutase [Methanomicrobiaceae archaeon]|nr:phosphoglucosamine mutase [Methanomicrobiaceae archaeon]
MNQAGNAIKQQKRLFGTNGVRGIVGTAMTPDLAMRIGMALASMRPGTIVVGRDTRTSGPALSGAIKAGIMACGCDVCDVGVIPTPALQYLVREGFDAGAMITASHNPPEYNGVKVIEADGTEMDDEETIALEERIFSEDFAVKSWDLVGTETFDPHLTERYIEAVAGAFPDGTGRGMTVVVDAGSGPASRTTPEILSRLGCTVHTINSTEDGTFPGRLPEPSPAGLAPLAQLVRETRAAFGVAHDGDADRAVFVDEQGDYLEENREFALMQRYMCRKQPGIVITTVATSRLCETVAGETGCRVHYTPVGSIVVARTMRALAEAGETVSFGGEGNGGLIFPAHQHCRDGGMTAAAMVALLTGAGEPLSALSKALPPYVMIKDKIHADEPAALCARLIEACTADDTDLTDGIRINRPDAWALLRPSGTEPFMRLVIEGENRAAAERLQADVMAVIGLSSRK